MSTSNTAGQKIFLLTPLRKGRPDGAEFMNYQALISTHAPAEGATHHPVPHIPDQSISTHAPAEGATAGIPIQLFVVRISTHAPAEGATVCPGS